MWKCGHGCLVGADYISFWMMGLSPDSIKVDSWDHGGKSKGRKKKDGASEETGCWIKFRLMGCISSRSKVENSVSGTSTNYGKFGLILEV